MSNEFIDAITSGDISRANEIFADKMKDMTFTALDTFSKHVSAVSVNLGDNDNGNKQNDAS